VEIQEVAEPAPKPNQLVVDVAYAGVVFPDVLQMPGEYQLRPELPFTPGWEVSGVVRVDAGGFRAEYVAQPAGGDQHQCEPQGVAGRDPLQGGAIRRHYAPTGGTESLGTVAIAISTDLAMSVAKAVAAALTGSAGLFAETLHALADTGNQLLLLKGLRGSRRRPDTSHPFGYGAELFSWSLLAALSIVVVGGVLSIWEGSQRLLHPAESRQAWWAWPCSASAACSTAPPGWPRCASSAGRRPGAGSGSASTCARPPTPRSRPSSTRTQRRCSATRSPSPGSACTSSSAPRPPTPPPGS
jgi:hypothetical protein